MRTRSLLFGTLLLVLAVFTAPAAATGVLSASNIYSWGPGEYYARFEGARNAAFCAEIDPSTSCGRLLVTHSGAAMYEGHSIMVAGESDTPTVEDPSWQDFVMCWFDHDDDVGGRMARALDRIKPGSTVEVYMSNGICTQILVTDEF